MDAKEYPESGIMHGGEKGSEAPTQVAENADLAGDQLIQALSSLTGMSESVMHQELDHIMQFSSLDDVQGPPKTASITLEELRKAMLVYLSALCEQEESSAAGFDQTH